MEMYDTYGGRMFAREEFRQRWGDAISTNPPTTLEAALYVEDRALVKPKLDAPLSAGTT
jgi:hypothetical protein